jgi:hypothetical protein
LPKLKKKYLSLRNDVRRAYASMTEKTHLSWNNIANEKYVYFQQYSEVCVVQYIPYRIFAVYKPNKICRKTPVIIKSCGIPSKALLMTYHI